MQPNVSLRLLGLDDAVDQVVSSDNSGAFNLTQAATAGNRYLLAIGARLSSTEPLEIRFNEALAEPLFSHFEVLNAGSVSIPVEVNDDSAEWLVGVDPVPAGITLSPAAPPSGTAAYSLTVTGTATPNQPVTLRNLTRGSWHRVDADAAGDFSLTHEVYSGDELRLLRSRHSVAYVTLDDFGLMIVNLNQVYGQEFQDPSQVGEVAGAFTLQDLPLGQIPACPSGPLTVFNPIDVKVLIGSNSWTVPTLAGGYGLLMLEVDPNLLGENAINSASLQFVSAHCGEVGGYSQMGGMEVVQGYPLEAGGNDLRDYVLVTNSAGWLLVYDATDPHDVIQVDQVALPGVAKGVVADPSSRRIYVTGSSEVYVLSFDEPGLGPVDFDGDGIDDRVLETIAVPAETLASPVLLAPDLGLGYVGGVQSGLSRMTLGAPDVSLVTEVDGRWQRHDRLAPYGVPLSEDLPASRS